VSRAVRWATAGAALAAALGSGGAIARGDMQGSAQLNVTASGNTCQTERIRVGAIHNDGSSATPSMTLRVWYHPSDNFFTSGYVVASYTVGSMAAGQTINNLDQTVNCSASPPVGNYCVTLALEVVGSTTEDYVKFPGCQHWPPGQACTSSLSCSSGEYYTPGPSGSPSVSGSPGAGLLLGLALLGLARRRLDRR
jgi:hypothetical protein